jgi:hypothetical protein
MENKDYPSLYQAADKASLNNQSTYVRLMGLNLSFMVIGAMIAILKQLTPTIATGVYIISSIMLFSGIIISFILKFKKFDDVWYQGRALAESVKTLTWRFMTCSEGFEANISLEQASSNFVQSLEEITTKFKDYTQHFDSKKLKDPNITDVMKQVRSSSLNERREYYATYRIEDQKEWYSSKAEYNRKKQNLWFIFVIIDSISLTYKYL